MSDLERAQAHLGCEQYQESPLVSNCWTHIPGGSRIADLTWPCSEATRLAALLAEVRAQVWDEGYEAGHATARAVNAEYPEEPANPYRRGRVVTDRQNAETLAASDLLAAAAIVAAEADERGMRRWTALADRLCVEAARLSVPSEEARDE